MSDLKYNDLRNFGQLAEWVQWNTCNPVTYADICVTSAKTNYGCYM